MYSGLGDNSAEVIAVVMIAAIFGIRRVLTTVRRWMPSRTAHIGTGAIFLSLSLWNQHLNGYTPMGSLFQEPTIGRHQRLADRFVGMIPPSAPVSTQDQLDPHLSNRRYLYLFEDTGRVPPLVPASDILLDVSAPTHPLPSFQLHDRAVAWIQRPGWGIAAANDGLLLIEKGVHRKVLPPRFYDYMRADSVHISAPLKIRSGGLDILGYNRQQTDLPNHVTANLALTFYLRPRMQIRRELQPVVFEIVHGTLIGCVHEPLGLAWLPTTQWQPHHVYAIRMDPLETEWQTPGVASLYVEIVATPPYSHPVCSELWAQHHKLWRVGTLDVHF